MYCALPAQNLSATCWWRGLFASHLQVVAMLNISEAIAVTLRREA